MSLKANVVSPGRFFFWAGQTITREFLISLTMIEKQALKEYVIETS